MFQGNRALVWTEIMDEIRCALECRADDSRESPGRIFGTLLRYGEQAKDRQEIFEAGSLSWPESGIILNRQHSRAAPIMRLIPKVLGDTVVIDAALPDTAAGRDTASEIRQGLFSGLSIEFRAIKQSFQGPLRRISQAALTGCGNRGFPLICWLFCGGSTR